MKILWEIPGYMQRVELQNYISTRPQITRDEAICEWMNLRIKGWILNNITNKQSDFEFECQTVGPLAVIVDFVNPVHGAQFYNQMGGRII
nr:hypothetical protein RP007_00743 [Rhizobium sp. P007]